MGDVLAKNHQAHIGTLSIYQYRTCQIYLIKPPPIYLLHLSVQGTMQHPSNQLSKNPEAVRPLWMIVTLQVLPWSEQVVHIAI